MSRQRLERALVRAGDGLAAAAVVEQRVDGLLQHALLVADDDLGRVELLQPLEAVVAVDDAAVEVVQVGGREAAAVERNERAEIRRDHRDHLEHHPLGLVADDCLNASTTLRRLAIFLRLASRGRFAHLVAQLLGELRDVDVARAARGSASAPMPATNASSPSSSMSFW